MSISIGPNRYWNSALQLSIGLLKVDSGYNNEFEKMIVPTSGGIYSHVVSLNYYQLNSNSKNISLAATIGIAYQFDR